MKCIKVGVKEIKSIAIVVKDYFFLYYDILFWLDHYQYNSRPFSFILV